MTKYYEATIAWIQLNIIAKIINKTMMRSNTCKMACKDIPSALNSLRHGRSESNKSHSKAFHKKNSINAHIYEKVSTQTGSSKQKHSLLSTFNKKIYNSKQSDGERNNIRERSASKRKGRLGKEKMFMMQSLNLPPLDHQTLDEGYRNISQQLTANLDQSVFLPASLSAILKKTQQIFSRYESKCTSMRRHQKTLEKELSQAKAEIVDLKRRLNRRSREV